MILGTEKNYDIMIIFQALSLECRLTTTLFITIKLSLLRLYSFDPSVNPQSHFFILKTPLMWPPCYYDQDFMAQWWLYLWGSTVISLSNNNNIRQMMNEKKK